MASIPLRENPAPLGRPLLLAGLLAGAALLGLFGFRLTLGTSLSDESYYANLVVGRLRHPAGDTGDNSAHLTFSLLIEPFVRAYRRFVPDLAGVILYLRLLYGAMALATAVAAWSLLRRVLPPVAAAAAACLPVAFIPFGLPAPSYNTVAMMGTISALCLFAGHLLDVWGGKARPGWPGWLAVPAAAGLFAVSVIAYPPALLAATAFILLAVLLAPGWKGARPLVPLLAFGAVFLLLGAALVVVRVGLPKIQAVLSYNRETGQHMDWRRTVSQGCQQFASQQAYPYYCVLAVLAGLAGRLSRRGWARAAQAAALLVLAAAVFRMPSPCFFAPGHDLVLLLALAGLPILLDLRHGKALPAEDRVLILLYCAGLAGGLLSAWTSSNAMINFPVGGSLAALASLACLTRGAALPPAERGGYGTALLPLGMLAALAASSGFMVYGHGRLPITDYRRVVPSGPFAGLRTTEAAAIQISGIQRALAPFASTCRSVLVASPYAGLYLLTPLKPRTPHSFFCPEMPAPWKRLREMAHEPAGLPDLVVVDPALGPPGPGQESLLEEHYVPLYEDGPVELHLRRGLRGPTPPALPYVVRFDRIPRGTGWSIPELWPDGRFASYMAAREATMSLPRPASAGALRLRIDVPCAIALDVLDSLGLAVNGHAVPLAIVPGPTRVYEAILEPAVLGAAGTPMQLRFSVNRTVVPEGGNRSLAVVFRGLEFTEAGERTAKQ